MLFQAGDLTLASTCGGPGPGFRLVPTRRAHGVTEYAVQDFPALSATGLTELALCWMAGGAYAAAGELILHGPHKSVTRATLDGELLVVPADWLRIPGRDEWACLLKSCGQAANTAVCAQRRDETFDFGHVAADAGLLYRLCHCSTSSSRNCTDRLPSDFTTDFGAVTVLCGAAQRSQDDVCRPCGPYRYVCPRPHGRTCTLCLCSCVVCDATH